MRRKRSSRYLGRPPQISLVLYHDDSAQLLPLSPSQTLVVGRGKDADLQLNDESLSRRHVSFTLSDDAVWVQDLKSTNGTRLNGRHVDRARVRLGDRVAIGSVTASLHVVSDGQGRLLEDAEPHEGFMEVLAERVRDARNHKRRLALLFVRALERDVQALGAWCRRMQRMLDADDLIGAYSADVVEILLAHGDDERFEAVAQACASEQPEGITLRCGGAVYPEAAGSPDELLERALAAVRQTSDAERLRWARARDSGSWRADSASIDVVWKRSPAMRELESLVKQVAPANIPALICGETGSGKEVIAHAIHERSKRHDKPMCTINCGAIPGSLIESTLFGHKRGAFTGADRDAKGVFEEADGGTLLLDEVGELSAPAQAALLRVIETKRVRRVGSSKETEVDVRILAATHRDLELMASSGDFRSDLLFRLNVVTLVVPPLRERLEEIAPLTRHFIDEANSNNDCEVDGIDAEALAMLRQYGWPGNVRELRNVIERAVVIAMSGAIATDHLPDRLLRDASTRLPRSSAVLQRSSTSTTHPIVPRELTDGTFKTRVRAYEKALIGEALRAADWNKAEAARRLRIPLRTLKEKVRVMEIEASSHDARRAMALISLVEGDSDAASAFKDRVRSYERTLIEGALQQSDGNKTEAARKLRIPLRTMKDKIRVFGL